MGIRGFSSFLEEHPDIYKPFQLQNMNVVMDGSSVVYHLYRTSETDFKFGGDYSKYATFVKDYFSTFYECGISPVVIFDGGIESSTCELTKLEQRQEERLKSIDELIKSETGILKKDRNSSTHKDKLKIPNTLLPINAYEVLKDILSEMSTLWKIQLVQCDYECDKQIAFIAKHYECPVLSEDADFCIYDLPHGFIRLSNVDGTVSSNSKGKYLMSKIYYVDSLLKSFPLKDREVLSLFSVLAFNDYTRKTGPELFESFFKKINVYTEKRFTGLLIWLRYKSVQEAKMFVLDNSEDRKKIKYVIDHCISIYKLDDIDGERMLHILNGVNSKPNLDIVLETKLKYPCGQSLPKKFILDFHKGSIPPMLLDVINLKKNFLSPQIEDFNEKSSYVCSQYFRQVTYSILLKHNASAEKLQCHEEKCQSSIKEYDRKGGKIVSSPVEVLSMLENKEPIKSITDMSNMEEEQLRIFINSVLNKNKDFCSDIEKCLHLLFCCIHQWLLKSVLIPKKNFLYALVLCITYRKVKKESVSEKEPGLMEKFDVFLKTVVVDKENKSYLRVLHSFSELQTCVLSISILSRLVGYTVESDILYGSLSGPLFYNIAIKLESEKDPKSFIYTLLGNNSEASSIFDMYLNKILEELPNDFCWDFEGTQKRKRNPSGDVHKKSKS